jgi:ABC-type dipeptide/oligopeptide/nickel transport system permease subunit
MNSLGLDSFRVWARHREVHRRLGVVAFLLQGACLVVLVGALLAWAWSYATLLSIEARYTPPCWTHPLGTDGLGRDLLARVVQGSSLSVAIGVAAACADVLLGGLVALTCLLAPRLDRWILALLDIGFGLPYLVLAAVLSSWCGSSWWGTLFALIAVGWIPAARLLRAHLLTLSCHESILTARLIGLGNIRLFHEYLWPACRPGLRAHLAAAVPQAILAESLLSFLGLGIRPPLASLGGLCAEGLLLAWDAPWMALGPIGALILVQFGTLWWADSTETQRSFSLQKSFPFEGWEVRASRGTP